MCAILIINGPNLNLLGQREPSIYGSTSFDEELIRLHDLYPDLSLDYFQSNIEGEIINKLHEVGFTSTKIILNAGGYTHTSVAIRDAISAIKSPVIEVHISNVTTRESFRHSSLITPVCQGAILGFGMLSYRLAIEAFLDQEQS